MHPLLQDYVCVHTQQITWGEMDAFNHVNNTVYFRYFENIRIKHFEQLEFMKYKQLANVGPILAETRCRFKAPLTYPDTVHIGVKVKEVGLNHFTHEYAVVSENLNCIAAEGDGRIVCFDYSSGRKIDQMPEDLLRQLKAQEQKA